MQITADTIMKISRNRGIPSLVDNLADFITNKGDQYHLDTALRVKHFLGQTAVESALFSTIEENLNYSAARLTQVWPSRFPTLASAKPYANNPRALANKTYGGRMGNVRPNDGWDMRGSGLKMVTGRSNITEFTRWMRKIDPTCPDFADTPDQLRTPEWAVWSAIWYWEARECWTYADLDDVRGLTRAINGGLIGLEDRETMTAFAGKVLNMRTDPAVIATPPKTPDPLLLEYQVKLNKISDFMKLPDLNVGKADGWNGPKTMKAVTTFQQMVKLNADGKLGPNTRLNIDVYMNKQGIPR